MPTFRLPIFPLPELILFPGTILPLHIFEPRYRNMLDFCLKNGNEMAISPILKDTNEGLNQIIGWGHVIQRELLDDGRSNILLEGLGIGKIVELTETHPFLIANFEKFEMQKFNKDSTNDCLILEEIVQLTKRILFSQGASEDILFKFNHLKNHPFPFDFISSILNFEFRSKQRILESLNQIEKAIVLKKILEEINLLE